MTGRLEAILDGKSPLRKARSRDNIMPFGGIIYKGRVILARIDSIVESVEYEGQEHRFKRWILVPFGLRKDNSTDTFDCAEEFHEPRVTEKYLKRLISEAGPDITDFIATVSLPYEHYPDWSNFDNPLNETVHPAIVEAVGSVYSDGCALLDLGAGRGKLAAAIKDKYPSIDIYALDYNEENTAEAAKLLGAENVRQGKAQDVASLFDGKKFDIIVTNAFFEREVLEHDSVAKEILQACHEQLNQGGYLIVSGYTPLLINRTDLERTGFDVLNTVVPENLFSFALPKQMYVARK